MKTYDIAENRDKLLHKLTNLSVQIDRICKYIALQNSE